MEAARFLDDYECGCQIVMDTMKDEANSAYGAFPERLYIILDGTIVYQGGMGPFFYKLQEVKDFLTTNS